MNVAALGDGANVFLRGVFLVEEEERVDFETRGGPGEDGEVEGDGGVKVRTRGANSVGEVAFEDDGGSGVGAEGANIPSGNLGGLIKVDGARLRGETEGGGVLGEGDGDDNIFDGAIAKEVGFGAKNDLNVETRLGGVEGGLHVEGKLNVANDSEFHEFEFAIRGDERDDLFTFIAREADAGMQGDVVEDGGIRKFETQVRHASELRIDLQLASNFRGQG